MAKARSKPAASALARRERVAMLEADNIKGRRKNLRLMSASFEAAEKSRSRRLRARFGSGDYHLDPHARDQIRNRSRDLLRNDGLYQAIIQRRTDMTVGRGLAAQAGTSDDAWNRQAETLWRDWAKGMVDATGRLTFNALQRLVLEEIDVAGDVLVAFTSDGLQVIESERIVSPNMGGARKPELIDGVSVDPATGRHSGYHVADYLPESGSSLRWTTKTLSAADAVLLTTPKRVSQVRGAPTLSGVLNDFDDAHEYRMASLQQAKIGAMLAFVGKVSDPTVTRDTLSTGTRYVEDDDDWGDGGSGTSGRTVYDQRMDAGQITWIGMGESLEAINHNVPQAQFDPFWRSIVSVACAAGGLPPEVVLMDFTKTSYSSARAALLQARTAFNPRRDWFTAFLARVWRWKVAGWVDSGALPLHAEMYRVRWTMPAMGQIDPLKEVEGNRENFACSFRTFGEIAEENGYDGEELMQIVAREKDRMRELGLEVPTTGGTAKAKDEEPPKQEAPSGAAGAD